MMKTLSLRRLMLIGALSIAFTALGLSEDFRSKEMGAAARLGIYQSYNARRTDKQQ